LPSKKKPAYLIKIKQRLQEKNIVMINTQDAFDTAFEIAADLIVQAIDSVQQIPVAPSSDNRAVTAYLKF
jgi:hypothetical protein